MCTWCKNGCDKTVLQVLFRIYLLSGIATQDSKKTSKGILSHVNGNRGKLAQGVFERRPRKQVITKFHLDQILKPDAENYFKVRTQSLAPAAFLTCP